MELTLTILANIMASFSVLFTTYIYYIEDTEDEYDMLDRSYLRILTLSMNYPRFRDPKLTKDYKASFEGEELIQYETYALIVWNFCETLYDRGNKKNMESWQAVIHNEGDLQRNWMTYPDNASNFKKSFRDFVENGYKDIKKK